MSRFRQPRFIVIRLELDDDAIEAQAIHAARRAAAELVEQTATATPDTIHGGFVGATATFERPAFELIEVAGEDGREVHDETGARVMS